MRLIVLVLGDFSHKASEEAPGVESALSERTKQGACQLPNLHSRCVPNENLEILEPAALFQKYITDEVDYEAVVRS